MPPGAEVKFKIVATGDCLSFQWQKYRRDLSDGGRYCDTDNDTLSIVEVEKGDKGRYRCHVSNYTGETFSKEAFLTVSKLVIVGDDVLLATKSTLKYFFSYIYGDILIPFL